MTRAKFAAFLFAIFIISNAYFCSKETDCHSFSVEVTFDGVEQLTAQTKNGTAPFAYKWDHGLGFSSVAIVPGPGVYTVTVTDYTQCKATFAFTVK